jgi:CRISPR system Cascade subunit CasC
MTRFVQLHLLTFYGPANLNRDDTGRPKTAMIGGVERLRVSSQALKRAVRTSDSFRAALDGHLAERTQRLGEAIETALLAEGIDEATARKAARDVAGLFGKLKGDKDPHPSRIEQLAFVGPQERAAALALARRIAEGEAVDLDKESPLKKRDGAADIAMFGRMLADAPDFNREAAVQVAHAFATHRTPVEDDYYTAVDDLKTPAEDAGAGFIGNTGFGSGIFYLFTCIDRELLIENLDGNEGLARDALAALARSLATVSPSGKQASFASRARADFILAERGDQQPRSLAGAFLKPVTGDDMMAASINALQAYSARMDRAYGSCADERKVMDVPGEQGTLDAVVSFVAR